VFAAAKRVLPWVNGLLAYLTWQVVGLFAPRRSGQRPVPGPVCVIQMNALGDVVMATPLLRALVDAFGPGQVDVVAREHTAPLLENFHGLGRIIRVKSHLYWRDPASVLAFFRLAWQVRNRRYQAVLDLSRLMQSAWLTYLSGSDKRVGLRLTRVLGPFKLDSLGYIYTDEIDADANAHMVQQNLSLLAPFNVASVSARLEFSPTVNDRLTATAWLEVHGVKAGQPYAVIHPGAKWPPKRWPVGRFRQVATHLQARGIAVVLAGDANDRLLICSIAEGMNIAPIALAGELELGAVGALIQHARLLIGNDSALMHLASALGTPTLALFGPTYPNHTGPLGRLGRAIAKPISCRPCRLYFTRDRCERGHNYCMDLIEVDEVTAMADELLNLSNQEVIP